MLIYVFADQNFPFMKVVIVGFERTLGVTVKFIMDSDKVLYQLKYCMKFERHGSTLRLQSCGKWYLVFLWMSISIFEEHTGLIYSFSTVDGSSTFLKCWYHL